MISASIKVHIALLLLAVFCLPQWACKKGGNDPAFSLKSRKSRLAGSWTLQTANWTHGDTTTVFDGTFLAISVDSVTDSLALTNTFRFDKDGTYEEVTVTEFPTNWQGNGQPAFIQTETNDGIWNFTGDGAGIKAKSQLLLQVTEHSISASNSGSNVLTTSYIGQTQGFIYNIDRLASKELILQYEFTITSTKGTQQKTAKLKWVK